MIGLLQRVRYARVEVSNTLIAGIDTGLLVFLGFEKNDTGPKADRLLERLLGYRVFPDADGRMNLSLVDVNGGLLLVPQFTLAADTGKGMRPGFSSAAEPEEGRELFSYIVDRATARHDPVEHGEFGADMQISLLNDGPVTFSLTV